MASTSTDVDMGNTSSNTDTMSNAPIQRASQNPARRFERYIRIEFQIDTCAICKNPFRERCGLCRSRDLNPPLEECLIEWGTCGHVFHLHCISEWIPRKPKCPIDTELDWKLWRIARRR